MLRRAPDIISGFIHLDSANIRKYSIDIYGPINKDVKRYLFMSLSISSGNLTLIFNLLSLIWPFSLFTELPYLWNIRIILEYINYNFKEDSNII